jgi:hypothetical protein
MSFLSIVTRKYGSIEHIGVIDPFIFSMEEPFINTRAIDLKKKWFRISINPTFRAPYAIIAETESDETTITLKITNGRGGYYPGTLETTIIRQIPSSVLDSLFQKLHNSNFWRLGKDTTCSIGFDGERWVIEGIENGKYHALLRWSPEHCGDNFTRAIAKAGLWLKNVSGMDSIYNAISRLKSGM